MILQSFLFGVIAALGFGFSDLLAAAVSRRLSVISLILVADLAALTVAAAYLPFSSSLAGLSLGDWGAIVGLGVLTLALTAVFYVGLRIGPVAVVVPIVSANAIVALLLAVVFLGERLGMGQSLGAAGAFAGVVLASTEPRSLRSGRRPIGKGVLMGLITMVVGGVWVYYVGVLSKDLGWFLPVYLSRIVMVAILVPTQLVRGRWPWHGVTPKLAVAVVLVGILETGGMFAMARGLEVGVVSVVATTLTLYPAVPVMGGLLMFRERLAPNQMIGLMLVLAGLVALGLTS